MTTRMPRQPTTQFTARLPAELHTWLAERAQKNHRSANAELAVLLELARDNGQHTEEYTCTKCGRPCMKHANGLCLICEDKRGEHWND